MSDVLQHLKQLEESLLAAIQERSFVEASASASEDFYFKVDNYHTNDDQEDTKRTIVAVFQILREREASGSYIVCSMNQDAIVLHRSMLGTDTIYEKGPLTVSIAVRPKPPDWKEALVLAAAEKLRDGNAANVIRDTVNLAIQKAEEMKAHEPKDLG
jgi:hypothetical protein